MIQTVVIIATVAVFVMRLEGRIDTNEQAISYERRINQSRWEQISSEMRVAENRTTQQLETIRKEIHELAEELRHERRERVQGDRNLPQKFGP